MASLYNWYKAVKSTLTVKENETTNNNFQHKHLQLKHIQAAFGVN